MRRMNADNHRGQEDKSFQKQAGYMRAMIFSHISEFCLASRSGSIYAGGRAKQEARAERKIVFLPGEIYLPKPFNDGGGTEPEMVRVNKVEDRYMLGSGFLLRSIT